MLTQLAKKFGVEQTYDVSGIVKDWVIHYLDGPPPVDVIIEIEPKEALPFTSVDVLNDEGESVLELPAPLSPHPYHVQVPAGFYSVGARITTSDSGFIGRPGKTRLAMPPRAVWKVKVS